MLKIQCSDIKVSSSNVGCTSFSRVPICRKIGQSLSTTRRPRFLFICENWELVLPQKWFINFVTPGWQRLLQGELKNSLYSSKHDSIYLLIKYKHDSPMFPNLYKSLPGLKICSYNQCRGNGIQVTLWTTSAKTMLKKRTPKIKFENLSQTQHSSNDEGI